MKMKSIDFKVKKNDNIEPVITKREFYVFEGRNPCF